MQDVNDGHGGSYIAQPDGTRTLVARTVDAEPPAENTAPEPITPAGVTIAPIDNP